MSLRGSSMITPSISTAFCLMRRSASAFEGATFKSARSAVIFFADPFGNLTAGASSGAWRSRKTRWKVSAARSEEHTSELQSQSNLVCRLLLEKKNVQLGRAGTVPQLGHLGRQGTQLLVRQVAGAGRGVQRSRVLPRGLLGRGGNWVSSGIELTVRAAFFTGLFGVSGVADGASGTGSVSFADSRAFSRRNVS